MPYQYQDYRDLYELGRKENIKNQPRKRDRILIFRKLSGNALGFAHIIKFLLVAIWQYECWHPGLREKSCVMFMNQDNTSQSNEKENYTGKTHKPAQMAEAIFMDKTPSFITHFLPKVY